MNQVSSGLYAFTSVFGMETGGAHINKTPANKSRYIAEPVSMWMINWATLPV